MVCCEDILPFTDKTMRKNMRNRTITAWVREYFPSTVVLLPDRGPGTRDIAAIAILTGLAITLAWFLVAADMRSDLSTLRPFRNTPDAPSILIGWPELRDPRQPSEFEQDPRYPATSVRMPGYMMEGVPPASESEEIKTSASSRREVRTDIPSPRANKRL